MCEDAWEGNKSNNSKYKMKTETHTQPAPPPARFSRGGCAPSPIPLGMIGTFSLPFSVKPASNNLQDKQASKEMATPKAANKKRGAAAKKGGSRSAKAGLIFPVGRIGSLLRRGQYAPRVGASSAVYLAAVVEYLVAELLELTVKAASQQKSKSKRLTPRALTLAVRHDDDLGALLQNVTLSRGGVIPSVNKALAKTQKGAKKSSATPSA